MDGLRGERRLLSLLFWIGICFVASASGALLGREALASWYPTLVKPAWTPPGWLFGPVWTVLYVLMGVAAWRIWTRFGWPEARGPLTLFLVQLALNALWTPAFFGLRRPDLGLVVIVLLWVALAATVRAFGRRDRLAGWLLVPYLGWVSFATALNFALWRLNPAG